MIHYYGACPECDMPCSYTLKENTWVCNCDCEEANE